jgi:hypothetical protein
MTYDRKILNHYLKEHHTFTLSVDVRGKPHSAPIFYAFDENDGSVIFMSDPDTIHGRAISENPSCSGAVHDNVRVVNKIRGLQFSGKVQPVNEADIDEKMQLYLKNFPEAENLSGTLYIFQIDWMKMTDNTVSFGFKREWGNDPFS